MGTEKDTKQSVFTRGKNALSEKDAERLFDVVNQAHLPYFMNAGNALFFFSLHYPTCG